MDNYTSPGSATAFGHCGAVLDRAQWSQQKEEAIPPEGPQSLPDIPTGCRARITSLGISGLLGQRLMDLGFTPGAELSLVMKGPKASLIAVSIRDTVIALRSDEALSIRVSL